MLPRGSDQKEKRLRRAVGRRELRSGVFGHISYLQRARQGGQLSMARRKEWNLLTVGVDPGRGQEAGAPDPEEQCGGEEEESRGRGSRAWAGGRGTRPRGTVWWGRGGEQGGVDPGRGQEAGAPDPEEQCGGEEEESRGRGSRAWAGGRGTRPRGTVWWGRGGEQGAWIQGVGRRQGHQTQRNSVVGKRRRAGGVDPGRGQEAGAPDPEEQCGGEEEESRGRGSRAWAGGRGSRPRGTVWWGRGGEQGAWIQGVGRRQGHQTQRNSVVGKRRRAGGVDPGRGQEAGAPDPEEQCGGEEEESRGMDPGRGQETGAPDPEEQCGGEEEESRGRGSRAWAGGRGTRPRGTVWWGRGGEQGAWIQGVGRRQGHQTQRNSVVGKRRRAGGVDPGRGQEAGAPDPEEQCGGEEEESRGRGSRAWAGGRGTRPRGTVWWGRGGEDTETI
uniref:glutenin, high molecular weight subunit DX5-like n=1 Tax=Macaca mulatta TaxID=9544 RepID=UPI0010A26CE0|nr:glutenin, high molecular weight subunit DX5-like [Macaca mulatta]